jgi:hypothetical protein
MVGSDKNYKASSVMGGFRKLLFVSDALLDLVWYVDGQLV